MSLRMIKLTYRERVSYIYISRKPYREIAYILDFDIFKTWKRGKT